MDIFIPYTGNDDLSILLMLEQLESEFKEKNNPLYAITAFQHAFKTRRPIPKWVLEFVARGFQDYLSNGGKKSLDHSFMLKSKGKDTPYKKWLLDDRDQSIMLEMYKLVELCKVPVEVAAEMVKDKLEATDWNQTLIELTELSSDTILGMYKKKWRKICRESTALKNAYSKEYFTKENIISVLQSYPVDSIPLELKGLVSRP